MMMHTRLWTLKPAYMYICCNYFLNALYIINFRCSPQINHSTSATGISNLMLMTTHPLTSAAETSIAEEAIVEHHRPQNTARVRKTLLKRIANRARAALRPDEPDALDFEVNTEFIDADKFLVGDIAEDGQRHFVFATDFQLGLLQTAKRWYMDGTFKV